MCVCVKTHVYVTELSTWACFNAGLAFKSEIFLKRRYSYGKRAKASTKKLTIRLSGITWEEKALQLQDWWKRVSWVSYDALSSNTNVLSKSSCNTKCSVSVLCCCKDKIPLLQRLKSQDRSPSTCLLATTKIKIFCSFELLCILHSVTWDSHKAVMWYMCESYEQFQRQKLMNYVGVQVSFVHGCLLPRFFWSGGRVFLQFAKLCNKGQYVC